MWSVKVRDSRNCSGYPQRLHLPMISFSARFLRPTTGLLLAALLAVPVASRASDPAPAAETAKPTPPAHQPVFEFKMTDFSDGSYRVAVEQMLQEFERKTGRKLV